MYELNILSGISKGAGVGILSPKNYGGVPLAPRNWTQKDRGKNGIWGQKI